MQEHEHFDRIFQRWEHSAKMRVWYNSKVKDVSNKYADNEEASDKELESLRKKIIEKAEFIVKLKQPEQWQFEKNHRSWMIEEMDPSKAD